MMMSLRAERNSLSTIGDRFTPNGVRDDIVNIHPCSSPVKNF